MRGTQVTRRDQIPQRLELYDTTLRDGMQSKGISMSIADKVRLAMLIDRLEFDYIEGGWPGANPKDTEFFRRALTGDFALEYATLTCFGSTRRPDRDAALDPQLAALIEAGTKVVCIVGKSSRRHVDEALQIAPEENLSMIVDTVSFLVSEDRRVFFDAEQFFDGYRFDPEYSLDVVKAASEAGAECIVLCDTNGGMLPPQIADITAAAVEATSVRIGIHTHNDTGCAVANAIAALDAGASHVQGTINGIGERCGNADLGVIAANLAFKTGAVDASPMRHLRDVVDGMTRLVGQELAPRSPYVGDAAFAHKAGFHASAYAKNPELYQHIDPETVGNRPQIVVSELSGRASITSKVKELGLPSLTTEQVGRVLDRVKELESRGGMIEDADGSFALLVLEELGDLEETFRPLAFDIRIASGEPEGSAEAAVEIEISGESIRGTAQAVDPVRALDGAFHDVIDAFHPELKNLELLMHSLAVLDEEDATRRFRVKVSVGDETRSWSTLGIGPSEYSALWSAMCSAYRVHILAAAHKGA